MRRFIFGLALLLVISVPSAHAQTPVASVSPVMTQTQVATPTPVVYELPYPGILPNSVLYQLKVLRDRIIGFLIADPLKKSQFDILQADKRVAAASALAAIPGSDPELVISTLSKATNYMVTARESIQLAAKQGVPTGDVTAQFIRSASKHRDVMRGLSASIDSPGLQREIERNQELIGSMQPGSN
jgi:hypothetical protein